ATAAICRCGATREASSLARPRQRRTACETRAARSQRLALHLILWRTLGRLTGSRARSAREVRQPRAEAAASVRLDFSVLTSPWALIERHTWTLGGTGEAASGFPSKSNDDHSRALISSVRIPVPTHNAM